MAGEVYEQTNFISTVVTSITNYYNAGLGDGTAQTNETNSQELYRFAGTLQGLRVRLSANTITATSTFRSRKNAANGGMSVSIGASTSGAFNDSSGTDAFVSGDKLNLQLVTGSTGTNMNPTSWSAYITPSGTTTYRYATNFSSITTASTTHYHPVGGATGNQTDETLVKVKWRVAGTLKNFYAFLTVARGTVTTLRVRKNAVNGNQSLSLTASTTGAYEDTTHTDTVAVGDDVSISSTTGTGTTTGTFATQLELAPTSTADQELIDNAPPTVINANATAYNPIVGGFPAQSNDNNASIDMPLDTTFAECVADISANTITGVAQTITVRKETVSTAIVVSITATTTGQFSDLTDSFTSVAGERINYQFAGNGSGTTTSFSVAWVIIKSTRTAGTVFTDSATESLGLVASGSESAQFYDNPIAQIYLNVDAASQEITQYVEANTESLALVPSVVEYQLPYTDSAIVGLSLTPSFTDVAGFVEEAPFPTVPLLDDFNRVSLGSNWTTPIFTGDSAITISGNQAVTSSNVSCSAYYSNLGVLTDSGAFLTITGVTTVSRVLARIDSPGGVNLNCYDVTANISPNQLLIRRSNAGSSSVLATFTNISTWAAGHKIGIRVVGSIIEAWVDQGLGWTLIGSVTDTTIASGYIGIRLGGTGATVDDFGGGIYSPTAPRLSLTPSGSDVPIFIDSNTEALSLSPSSVDVAQDVDSITVGLSLTPSAADTAQYIDQATEALALTVSAAETAQFFDTATEQLTFIPSSVDTAQYIDSSILGFLFAPSSTEIAQYIDQNTEVFAFIVSAVEVHEIPDSGTETLQFSPSGVDTAQFLDTGTEVLALVPSVVEGHEIFDAATERLSLVPSVTDTAQFVDQNTEVITFTPSVAEIAIFIDIATESLGLVPSSTDIGQFVDLNTEVLGFVPSSLEVHEIFDVGTEYLSLIPSSTDIFEPGGFNYPDADTEVLTFTASAIETAQFADLNTETLTLIPSSTDQIAAVDTATEIFALTASGTDIAQFVDLATEALVFSPSAVELHEIPDLATEVLSLTPSSTDIAQFVDLVTGVIALAPSAAETSQFIDSATETLSLSPTAVEAAQFADLSTERISLVPSSTEIAQYIDLATAILGLIPSVIETSQFIDSNTERLGLIVSGVEVPVGADIVTEYFTLTPSGVDVLTTTRRRAVVYWMELEIPKPDVAIEYTDTETIYLSFTAVTVEYIEHLDSDTAIIGIVPSGDDIEEAVDEDTLIFSFGISADEVPEFVDEDTAFLSIDINAIETAQFIDDEIIVLALLPDSIEIKVITDVGTERLALVPSSVDIRERVDAATVSLKILVTRIEIAQFVDTATEVLSFNVSAVEAQIFAERATETLVLVPSSTDIAQYIDQATEFFAFRISTAEGQTYDDSDTEVFLLKPTSIDIRQAIDSGTVFLLIDPSAQEEAIFFDRNIEALKLQPSGLDIVSYVDTNTQELRLFPSAQETAQFLDASEVTEKLTPSVDEGRISFDTNIEFFSLLPSATEIQARIDSAEEYLSLTGYSVDFTNVDFVTYFIGLYPSGVEYAAIEYVDSSEVYFQFVPQAELFGYIFKSGGAAFVLVAGATQFITLRKIGGAILRFVSGGTTPTLPPIPTDRHLLLATRDEAAVLIRTKLFEVPNIGKVGSAKAQLKRAGGIVTKLLSTKDEKSRITRSH